MAVAASLSDLTEELVATVAKVDQKASMSVLVYYPPELRANGTV
jgi:hypothetical protein